MEKKLIYLEDAIGITWEEPSYNDPINVLTEVRDKLRALPSAEPESCEDAVSRQAVSSWLKQYGQDVLHGKYKFSLMYVWKNLMDLPSVTPKAEQLEIIRCRVRCRDCEHYKYCDWTGLDYFDDDDLQ